MTESSASAPPPHLAQGRSGEGVPDPLIGQTTTRYRIEERLGGGGMGVVYRARDLTLDRDAALKFLPPHLHADSEARAQLVREAKAASALDHPNVAVIYEIGEAADGRLFIAMACYTGETLKKKVERGPLDVATAVDYALQAGAGLARAHEAGIVHRDVKPANLIVTEAGRVKVLDFGVAAADGAVASGSSGTGGSAPYMSPEQARGEPSDPRTDVWGLGATLYELLAGEKPFDGSFTTAVLYAVLHTEPRPLGDVRPDLPPGLAEVVQRCLAKDPADRYPTVEAFLDALRPFGPEVFSPSRPVLGRLRVRYRRLPLVGQVGLAIAALVVVAALAWAGLRPSGPQAQHLVILPFRTIGGDAEAEVFAAGLLETITSGLSQLEQFDGSLWVVPASEVTPGMTPTEARDQLGVTLAVDGTVQTEGGRVRLLLNLIDTRTRRQLASGQVDYEAGSALIVQDQAVLRLAQMLQVEIEPRVREALAAGGTDDDRANALYLRGRGVLRDQQSLADAEQAARLFRQAVERDPTFALAHAALGEASWRIYLETSDTKRAEEAVRHSERALALDASLAPVHISLAAIHAGRQDFARALRSVDEALKIDPSSAEAYRQRGSILLQQGQHEEAETALKRSIALKPEYWRGYNTLGAFYHETGRYDEAVATYQEALEVAPSNLRVLTNMAAALHDGGRMAEATAVLERVLRIDPDHPTASFNLATALFYQGAFGEAADIYAAEQARLPDAPSVSLALGDALWWTPGRRAEAADAYGSALDAARRTLAFARTPEGVGALAAAHARLGASDSARVYLEEVISLRDPDDVDMYTAFGIGELYESLGERDEAVRWVRSALDRGYGAVPLDHSPWLRQLRRDLRPSAAP